jgi:hypothetical protein
MTDDDDDSGFISITLMLYAVWCLLVFLLFVSSAFLAWGTDTMPSSRSGGVYVSGPSHK